MSEFERRSPGKMARTLALPTAIAFSLLIYLFPCATAGSCAGKGSSIGGGAAERSSQIKENEESDAESDPMPPLPEDQNDDSEPVSQDKTSSENGEPKSPARDLPPPLKALNEAAYLYDRSAGGSCDLTKAFAEAREQAASHKEDLEWIASNGTPAGKIYAAVLIRHFDKPKGQLLLEDLKKDKETMVKLDSLEGSYHYSLAEIATDLLGANSIIRLESDR